MRIKGKCGKMNRFSGFYGFGLESEFLQNKKYYQLNGDWYCWDKANFSFLFHSV